MNLEEYERIQPNTTVDGMLFNLPNTHVAWRVQTIYSKEPDTVAWIRSMKAGQTFYDVGANIGLYTLLAAKQGMNVFAFEPEAQNYALLIRNLAMNKALTNNTVAFPFCISDGTRVDTLRLSDLRAGGSCHSFASDLNYKREQRDWAYRQGTIGLPLDTLVFECGLPQPDHVKVDVDGFEDLVIKGAAQVLQNVQSVLLELDGANADHMAIRDHMFSLGFVVDDAQVEQARRKEGAFTGIGNQIFHRTHREPASEAPTADAVSN